MKAWSVVLLLISIAVGASFAGCEDDVAKDCTSGTECPGGGCINGLCVEICSDPCGGRDDLQCIIRYGRQECVSAANVSVDPDYVPQGTGSGIDVSETDGRGSDASADESDASGDDLSVGSDLDQSNGGTDASDQSSADDLSDGTGEGADIQASDLAEGTGDGVDF
ncbi:MAG: hypothetical protein KC561_17885 [Myxococcales bacterium]|nr:hypothetical protein [Myxococcales bacterium]